MKPDPAPLIEIRDALQRCIDMIESDMPRGNLWQYTYDIAFTNAVEKITKTFWPGQKQPCAASSFDRSGAIPVGQGDGTTPPGGTHHPRPEPTT